MTYRPKKPKTDEKVQKKELPIVTIEQAVAFEAGNPETMTPSRIVNAVLAAMGHVEAANKARLSEYLGISETAIAGAIEYDTGLTFVKFIEQWRYESIKRAKENGMTRFSNEFARGLGFANNSALWLFMKRHGQLNWAKIEANRNYYRRLYGRVYLDD